MRKAMWKKGLSVAMAAAMLTGTVTVPAVFNTSAIVKAAEVAEKSMPATPKAIDGMVYATVNMEYADFFYGELNNIAAGNETTPDLSNDKVASYRETGMYDAVTSATNKKSIKYATSYYKTGVANDEDETKGSDGTISNTTLYGIKEVKIAIPKALYDNLYEQKDDSANKNSKIYEYLNSPEAETNEEGFLIDPEAATIGYMIDGHHRNEGAYNAAKKIKEVMEEREIQDNDEVYQKYQYEFPTSIYIGRSRKDMAGIFGGINNKQQKPSAIHVMAIRQMSLDLDEEEDLAARVMEKMNSENDSVLKDRIKVCDGRLPKGAPATFLNNAKMVKLITDWWKIAMKNPSSWKCKGTDNNIYTFLNDYLTAYKEVFPEAWDNKNYVLTKTMGFDIIFSICNQLTLNAVDISGVNRLPDKDAFVSILQKVFFTKDDSGNMVPVEVELDGENAVPFNWESSIYGSHSSGKGINILKKIVEQLIISRVDH